MILSSSSSSSSSPSSSLLLSFSSSSFLLSVPYFPERDKFFAAFLILSLVCSGAVAQNQNSGIVVTHLDSGTAAQLPGITAQNLATAAQIPGTVGQNLDSVVQHEQRQREQQCPVNTFRCGDGSCIPQDWVGDGEADCHDSSDETTQPTTLFINPSSSNASERTGRTGTVEEAIEDPFDQIATVAPSDKLTISISPLFRTDPSTESTRPPPSGFLRRIGDVQGCMNIVQTRVDQCSADLTSWLQNIQHIDLTNSSILNDEARWSELDHGCELLLEFRTCTETLNVSGCVLPQSIELWNNIELYTCQLLLPSIKEYRSCFANARNAQCPKTQVAQDDAPPICRILTSAASDLRCIQQHAQSKCTANALEVIGPLQSETDHMYTQLACAYLTGTKPTATPAGSIESRDDEVPCCHNVLHTFNAIDSICAKPASEQWKPVHRVVCANRNKIIQQKQCFLNASSLAHCDHKGGNETVCGALELFSNNIDCALQVMNDVCTVEAQSVVVAVQDSLNDDLIANRCYVEAVTESSSGDGQFKLNPKNPRCTSEQENLALACLVELVDVNRKMAELQSLNFLHEISEENSSLVSGICELYQKYELCINNTVFVHSEGQRCAFNSPLNTLARIGLSPICSQRTRALLRQNNECIQKIKHRTGLCQSGLNSLGPAIHSMLQGIHAEAHLCNSYYLIREAFICGEKIVAEACAAETVIGLRQIQQLVTDLGTEEGCPEERPSNLQEIISRPAAAPTARPLPKNSPGRVQPQPQPVSSCDPEEQKRFAACIQPITTFQPHPLAVIKQPKQIDDACKQFIEFKKCQAVVSCFPLWAKGMSAMFEFACGPGYNTYLQVRQCVRKTTTREDIRGCVGEFSRGAPQLACQSANRLLGCAVPIITEKCGQPGAQFVTDYIDKFASAIDPECKVGTPRNEKAIAGLNCTGEQTSLIDRCAAPINELTSRIDELFEGGLQQFLANVKNLAPVFAQGCNMTSEFRDCLRPILQQEQCIVSSCLIRAGDGICDQPDTAQAIDDNLACVFKQASEPEFGKCLRSTIATLKQFNLAALRSVLPQFVNCVEHIVVQHCGQTPVNVLRAISTTETCPISMQSALPSSLIAPKLCTEEMHQKHSQCVGHFYQDYRMLPVALLSAPSDIDKLCEEASTLANCSYPVCEESRHRALKALVEFVCIRHNAYKKHFPCLASVATSPKGSQCLAAYLTTAPERQCLSLSNAASCAASHVNDACGYDALTLSFEGMHAFAKQLDPMCVIQVPVATLKTSCAESDVVEYLQCDHLIDQFSFTPLSFIRHSEQWSDFCGVMDNYESCLANMSCQVEPISSANRALFKTICGEQESTTRAFLPCLTRFANTDTGKSCTEPFTALDLLAKDIPHTICSTMERILSCAALKLSSECTEQALKYVSMMLSIWTQHFDPNCTLTGSGTFKEAKPEVELLLDSSPTQIAFEQTATQSSATTLSRAPFIITASSVPEPGPSSLPEPVAEPGTSSNSPSATRNLVQEITVNSLPHPEPEPTSVVEPETSSVVEPSFVPEWKEGSSSRTLPLPEPTDDGNKSSDVSIVQPVAEPSPQPGQQTNETASNTKWRTQGTERTYASPTSFWTVFLSQLSVIFFVQAQW